MANDGQIFLTGASGVLGSALLEHLSSASVAYLSHSKPVRSASAGHQEVRGDLRKSRMGLSQTSYSELGARVRVVIHAAATTDFLDDPAEIHELNVTGTQHVIEFAKAARASLIYVSTAFVDRLGDALSSGVENEAALGRNAYLESKLASEALVRSSDLRHVIVRPSVVIGDSSSAHIARPQGLHMMLKAFCSGTLPFIPMAAGSSIDFLPQDLVAAEIAQIANSGAAPAPKGPVWLTAGPSAVSVEEMVRCCRIAMKGGGVKVSEPRYFDQETLDRLIVPAFVEALPEDVERRMWNFLALTTLFSTATPFTSSLAAGREASIRHKSLIAALERTIDRYCLPDPNKVTGRVGVSA